MDPLGFCFCCDQPSPYLESCKHCDVLFCPECWNELSKASNHNCCGRNCISFRQCQECFESYCPDSDYEMIHWRCMGDDSDSDSDYYA